MLLCRRIFRARTSNPIPTRKLAQTHVRNTILLDLRTSHANLATREIVPKVAVCPTIRALDEQPPDRRAALLERVLRVSRHTMPVPDTPKGPKLVGKTAVSTKGKHDPFVAYAELRTQDRSLLASLPSDVLCRLAEGAVKYGSQDFLDCLTADILDDSPFYAKDCAKVAAILLCIPRQYSSLLDKQKMLSLLTLIHHQDQKLPPPAVVHVMKAIVDRTPSPQLDESLMNFVLSPFLNHLASLPSPAGAEAISYRPPREISIAYGLIEKLVTWNRFEESFHLLQSLSDRGHVPPEAFQTEVPGPLAHDFAVIVRSTLARASLHWRWFQRGVGFIASILQSQDSLKQDLESHTLELLYSSLVTCSSEEFTACAWLMCHLVDPRHGIILPTETVQLYYNQAFRFQACESAFLFYSHSQSRRVTSVVNYPPPRGNPLLWLMKYLTKEKHEVHLARCLAKQVVDHSIPIPDYDRSQFIALAAERGFATQARALWERYSVGRSSRIVVANKGTMLRMVSLFTKRDLWARDVHRRELLRESTVVEPPGEDQKNHTEYHRFAYRVVLAFHKSIMPLQNAYHFDLTALARGYFMLGEVTEALRPFQILLGRHEIPDEHDLNIAIGAMARRSPRAAYQMLERMIELGLRPQEVTFGTVVHQAIEHGDVELVTQVWNRAREVGMELSAKSTVALIRACIAVRPGIDHELLKANVRRAWDIIHKTPEPSVVHTPNLGKRCIDACLHLGDPVMAFKFWARMIRGKTQWDDGKQAMIRYQINKLTRRHCAEGELDLERARMILRELGDRRDVDN